MADYCIIKPNRGEICYGYEAFKRLSVAAICRRYGYGDDWVDAERDEQAEREVEHGVA